MNQNRLTPRQALNKAFLKVKPQRSEIECFKENMLRLNRAIAEGESEEFHKNLVSDFLKNTYFKDVYFINTKGRNDMVIHNGKNAQSTVGVIIETKSPTNKAEMIRVDNLNVKALQELVLYYLRERITLKNLEIKQLVATNIYEWFIFDAQLFERLFARNKKLVEQFTEFEAKGLVGTNTDFFYKVVAKEAIEEVYDRITFTHFDIRDYEKPLRNTEKTDDTKLISLYKLLSPEHLLKRPFANDSNTLDKGFYSELLHIIGLTEVKEGGKKVITRKKEGERNPGSLIENAIVQLDSHDKINHLPKPSLYGANYKERIYNVALELAITWVNRILFMKLLEAQLKNYHKGDTSYAFMHSGLVTNYDDLNALFFSVLARRPDERPDMVSEPFAKVPYLNSSLFESTEVERDGIFISQLKDLELPIISGTVLKDLSGKKRTGKLNALKYLFAFLDAYDFASEGSEDIQEDNKTLINASVLGLIFEKINGYKDGSFFTPGFITMYMCRETIRRAVVQKFNEAAVERNLQGFKSLEGFDEIFDTIGTHFSKEEANGIINSLKICDPAVGSGHFLVSALNELIAIKSELKILLDRQGKTLRDYHVEVQNDELMVFDDDGELFSYNPKSKESQRVQETLFHEKQTIIENCLFGVDINPNSVKICRLRLWIELLKNAYYRVGGVETRCIASLQVLETLPNIDINIKCGNSLISRYTLDADIKKALKRSKWSIDSYRLAVMTYRNAESKDQKREMERLINQIKNDFESEITLNDKRVIKLNRLRGELLTLTTQTSLFEQTQKEKTAWNKQVKKLTEDIKALDTELAEIKNNKIYENAFEWRFEFPEVLNDEGDFVGFDVVIGNPPYIRQEEFSEIKSYLQQTFSTYTGTADLYVFFVERGIQIVKTNGEFCYIMPNKWMQTGYGKPLRSFLLNYQLQSIVDFGDLQVFDEATTYPCILHYKKDNPAETFKSIVVRTLIFDDGFEQHLKSIGSTMKTLNLSDETWMVSSGAEQSLIGKIKETSISLSEYVDNLAFRGVLTGLTEAFIIDAMSKDRIADDDLNSIELIKPVLRGRDIKPWYSSSEGVYLISTFPSLKLNIDDYPAIKNHLLTFGRERLEQCGLKGARKKTSNKWYETQDSIAYWREFQKPKIMYQKFQVKPCFIYDDQGLYCNDSMWIIPKDDKFLVGILNSKIGWWLISKYCTAIQNGYQLIWKYFGQIPIARVSEFQKVMIIELVDQIISQKKQDLNSDISSLESQIDQLVYELYGLTEEEIRIVEGER